MTAPGPGYDRFQCRNFHNCGQLVRIANTYCDRCTIAGHRSIQGHQHSGLSSETLGVGMALAEYGIPSGIRNFSSEPDYYPCSNGCGNMVRIANTMCDRCMIGIGPPFNNPGDLGSGLAHEASGVGFRLAEYGTTSGIPGTSEHGPASYPCKNPFYGNKVQDRGDLCEVCLNHGPDSNGRGLVYETLDDF